MRTRGLTGQYRQGVKETYLYHATGQCVDNYQGTDCTKQDKHHYQFSDSAGTVQAAKEYGLNGLSPGISEFWPGLGGPVWDRPARDGKFPHDRLP